MTKDVDRLKQVIQMAESPSGKIEFAPNTVFGKANVWTEAEGLEVVGDAAANGTTIVSLSVGAYKTFICTSIAASTNIAAILAIAYGTLAAHTDVYHIDLQNAGSLVAVTEDSPIFKYYNSTAAAVTLLIIAPQTAMGAATNNDANHYFNGFLGGLIL